MVEEPNFCMECGAKIEGDVQFCPSCGAELKKQAEVVAAAQAKPAKDLDGRRSLVLFLLAAYAIPVCIVSVVIVAMGGQMADIIWENADARQAMIDAGYATKQALIDALTLSGGLMLASGACVAVSFFMTLIRKMWILALILCVAGSILSYSSIIGLVIGLIVSYLVYTLKPTFIDS